MVSAPYQCIRLCGDTLVAATGSHIDTYSQTSGAYITRWSCPAAGEAEGLSADTKPSLERETSTASSVNIVLENEPPTKKRRLSEAQKEDDVPTSISKTKMMRPRKPTANALIYPNVTAVAAATDGRHVVAITGEDKTVRVFGHEDGVLTQLSTRPMPKRPCAIVLTCDESTIIVADKFGDVYSMPLLYHEKASSEYTTADITTDPTTTISEPKQEQEEAFVSSATNLTVHTRRNLQALKNQQRQKKSKEKEEIKFEHKLLLGHVSMLTDVAYVKRRVNESHREYLITADRDEHIRVSRGIPQTHIIENFCLGHKQFVTRLCIPQTLPDFLVSGGGEEYLYVWKWAEGQFVSKFDTKDLLMPCLELEGLPVTERDAIISEATPSSTRKYVVSSIIDLGRRNDKNEIAVTWEATPTLAILGLNAEGRLELIQVFHLRGGNILDLVSCSASDEIVVSMDYTSHVWTTRRKHAISPLDNRRPSLQRLTYENGNWQLALPESETPNGIAPDMFDLPNVFATDTVGATDPKVYGDTNGLLYNLQNLRKRGSEGEE